MNTLSVLCTKHEGKLKLLDKASFDAFWSAVGEGEELELTIEQAKRRRTLKQNRFFHGPVVSAFVSLGYRQQEAKDMLCLMFIPQDVKLLDGSTVRMPGHTSALTVEEFNALIEACIQLAAENDIYIQDAAEWRAKHGRAA